MNSGHTACKCSEKTKGIRSGHSSCPYCSESGQPFFKHPEGIFGQERSSRAGQDYCIAATLM